MHQNVFPYLHRCVFSVSVSESTQITEIILAFGRQLKALPPTVSNKPSLIRLNLFLVTNLK